MVRFTLALLALVPAVFATSFSGLRALQKRQTLSGDATGQVQGLLILAQQVFADAQAGNITTACSTWAGSLSQFLDQLDSCASSRGATSTSAASGFATFCTNTLPSVAQSGLTSTVGASSTSSGSAAQSSAASSASRAVSALSSSASSIFSAASSAASSAQSSTPSGTNPTSGASKRIATAGTVAIASLASIMLMS
ncbi:hypothetical protein JCM3766R1_000740 [Sporobolomyces carnicolor]